MTETHSNAESLAWEPEHELTMDCVCGPDVEWFDPETGEAYESPLVTHHSLDGREFREPADG